MRRGPSAQRLEKAAVRAAEVLFVLSLLVTAAAAPARSGPGARGDGGGLQLPRPEKIVLSNGMVVFHRKNSDLPIVSFHMMIKGAGVAHEPAELEGIADLTAQLMLKGAAGMGAEAVAEALDFMGADLEIMGADEYLLIRAESLTEHFPEVLGITSKCLMKPAFAGEEFSKLKARRIDGLKAVKDEPYSAVRLYFRKAYFESHPMAHLSTGTETSLKRMKLEDVKAFYEKYVRPGRAIAAVVGDIDETSLLKLLEAGLGQWKNAASPAAEVRLPPFPRASGKKLVLVDKPDATQAYFMLGAPGYAKGDEVTPQAEVINTLWGGRFTSWFNTELRIKRGLTYGARSRFQEWARDGLFSAASYTKNDKIGEMLDITLELLKKARREGFAAEEIESARNYIRGQFPPELETNARQAQAYAELAFYGLDFNYYAEYLAAIRAVTRESAVRAAVRLIPENDFVLVVVGKAGEIRPQLRKYGEWQEKKITDRDF
ncbi:MAG: pitrilysin family protein [Acidobacteriota bacterium]|nr:pitrilysin family protein [Acidobacteriota bacterium]